MGMAFKSTSDDASVSYFTFRHILGKFMASCAVCETTILFGGKSHSGMRFCSDACAASGYVLAVAKTIPDSEVIMLASRIHAGKCPKCNGHGPVEVHSAYEVMSFILMTQWKTVQQISCRGCGIKKQALSSLKSALLGWWGFPWGLVMTPIQVGRNIFSMIRDPNSSRPSRELMSQARLMLANENNASEQ